MRKKPWVRRSPAVASWTLSYRWGSQLGDVREIVITRVDGGALTFSRQEIPLEMIAEFVEAVNEAAAWSDKLSDSMSDWQEAAKVFDAEAQQ